MTYCYKKVCAESASLCTPEQRKTFMAQVHDGKTLGEARQAAGVDFDAMIGIMNENILSAEYLRPLEEVK